MSQTIVINGKYLCSPITGVQRYAWELFERIDSLLYESSYRNIRLICFTPFSTKAKPQWKNIEIRKVGRLLPNLWEQIELPMFCGDNLLFSPANTGPIFYRNQVINFHDAAVFAVPEAYSFLFRLKYYGIYNFLGRFARAIITDSHFSQSELARSLNLSQDRFEVIYLGGDHFCELKSDINILNTNNLEPKSYLLSVASLSRHKNFQGLLTAAQLTLSDLNLVVVGGRNNRIFQKDTLDSNPEKIRFIGYVSDPELKALYENAKGFIFPSYYEGFGLPILEAMSCGCPVICSDAASLQEVAGNAALYFDPLDVREMAVKIDLFLNDPELRSKLETNGHVQAEQFHWGKTARQTLDRLVGCL